MQIVIKVIKEKEGQFSSVQFSTAQHSANCKTGALFASRVRVLVPVPDGGVRAGRRVNGHRTYCIYSILYSLQST